MPNIVISIPNAEKRETLALEEALKTLNTAVAKKQADIALAYAYQIIEQVPDCLAAYSILYKVLMLQQNYSTLENVTTKAIKENPNHALSHHTLANAYRFGRKPKLALQAMEKAVTLAPNNTNWLNDLAIMYKELGHFEQALIRFEQCISQSPMFTEAYWHRSDIKAAMPNHYVEQLIELVNQMNSSKHTEKVYACYALFRHFEEVESFEKAFSYLKLGSAMQRKSINYNHQTELTEHKNIESVFNPSLLSEDCIRNKVHTNFAPSDSPIFICGLPRSGTTLTEQIISSHSDVAAGDELFELAKATQLTLQEIKPKQAFPFLATELSSSDWLSIGKRYLELTQHINTKRFFTDKMPLNYKAIGLINLALPDAKIVYCQRPPMDLLLGAYKQVLGQGNKYTYDLDELTSMIIAHHRLMQHWLNVLPNKIFTLDYQQLINHQQETTEKLLHFLGLEWQESCLNFHLNNRIIHTLSNTQVRQPLYSSALNSWKKYQKQLTPYAEKMVAAGITL